MGDSTTKRLSDEAAWLIANKQLREVHRRLRSCDLDHLPEIKRCVDMEADSDELASQSQVAVVSPGNAELARAVAIEVCRDRALQGPLTPDLGVDTHHPDGINRPIRRRGSHLEH